ncbi:MAG: hypothetical protein AAF560_25485 [Acidobacteriota bacterium]
MTAPLPKLLTTACLLAFGLMAASVTLGEEESQPLEEVFLSELVYPQEAGEFQLTLAPSFSSAADEEAFAGRATVEYGLTDDWQIELEWDVFVRRDSDGMTAEGLGDAELAVKWARMEIAENTHLAFGLEIGLPIANVDDELGEGLLEIEPFAVVARDFPRWRGLQLFAQVGLGLVDRIRSPSDPDDEEPEAHELEVHLGAFLPTRHFVATLELSGSDNTWNHDGEERELYLTPGLVWASDSWEMGLGVPIGIGGDADDYQVIAMFTVER